MDEDLTKIQFQDLKGNKAKMVEARKQEKWVVPPPQAMGALMEETNDPYRKQVKTTILNQFWFIPKLFWRAFLLKNSMSAIVNISTCFDYASILYNAPNYSSIQVNQKPIHCYFVFGHLMLCVILKH
jgi:hypothetical protein